MKIGLQIVQFNWPGSPENICEREDQETVDLIKKAGAEAIVVKTDVAKEPDVKAMVEKAVATYGRLDYAFNNAGIEQLPTPLAEQT